MSMHFYDNRVRSYKITIRKMKWPYKSSEYKPTPETLSLAGFYFNPSKNFPDNVTCFLCHESMDSWCPEDDPFEEHSTNFPECAWVICQRIKRELDNNIPFNWDNEDQWPKSKNMCEIRLRTFSNWWPHDGKKNITSKKMADAGFCFSPSYTSVDNVFCMYCGIELEGWNPDDNPNNEHHRRGNTCLFFAKPPKKSRRNKNIKKDGEDGVMVVDLTNNISISNERINESPNIININDEPPMLISTSMDEPLNITSVDENRIDESQNIINMNDEPPMIISMNVDEPLNITSVDENRIYESPNIININEEVPPMSSMYEPLNITSIYENEIDESLNIINMNEEVIPMIASTNMDVINMYVNPSLISIDENGNDEPHNIIGDNNTDEEGTRIVKQVNNAQTNEEEIIGLINNDRTKGDESVEQVSNVKSNEGIDKLIRTQEEIKERSINFSNEEGINEKLNNISENEEHLMSQDLLNYVLMCVEEDERENAIINKEEQSNVIDEEGRNNIITNEKERNIIITNEKERNNIITNEEERNNIIENEEKLDIIVNKESNNMITDEKERDIITDMEELCIMDKSDRNIITDMEELCIMDKSERNIITDMEELNIIDEIITDEGDIIDGQVNNVKSIEEIYKMGDIITKGKLNNKEKIDEQLNIFDRNEERIEQLNNFTNERRINELLKNVETKENNKNENLKTTSPTIRAIMSPYTPLSYAKRNAAFTVEDYLRNLKGTQNMRITEKTNRKI